MMSDRRRKRPPVKPPIPPVDTSPPGALPANVVGEYWRTDGSPAMSTASSHVNVFFLAFAKSAKSGTGTVRFTPDEGGGVSQAQLVADIAVVRARGARVILSVGGSDDGGIAMVTTGQVSAMVTSVSAIADTYHCDGIDWDLEHGGDGTNLDALVSASARLKAARGADFIVTAAVEPGLDLYERFALATGSATQAGKTYSGPVCDLYSPQFYDYSQTNAQRVAGIMENARRMIFLGLPASKYAIGTTYAGSYLGSSGQMPVAQYLKARSDLRLQGVNIRGAFVWDMTIEADNDYPFAKAFGPAAGAVQGGGSAD